MDVQVDEARAAGLAAQVDHRGARHADRTRQDLADLVVFNHDGAGTNHPARGRIEQLAALQGLRCGHAGRCHAQCAEGECNAGLDFHGFA